ncbi:isoprenyl transferase [Bacillus sp. FJAT-49711]|uniref:isoprenyl transferase n=1 Tax=Bacillus sp. FJAT-49711 TaxID=2833585 RepID=UPI001BC9E0A6|nr:isoprenyl transferase [Bacillus sp. FJAT-49711]MBS4217719.1 isoprenyl transferase [Bacillus sp. FJAT-49711]
MLNKIKLWKSSQKALTLDERVEQVLKLPIPNHIAIIMDGNGRWAKRRALPRIAGHHEGMRVVRKITMLANKLHIDTLTLYAFSTENWKRPKHEVDYLMGLPEEFLGNFLPELIEENVKVCMIGNENRIPDHTRRAVEKAIEETSSNTGLKLNFALNYGGRAEIIEAVREISNDVKNGKLQHMDIDDDCFSKYLMTHHLSDPDLLIRTSGELRISNFMLWQIAYSELWFTDVLWPDFTEKHLLDAVEAYQRRTRRFGGIHSEESKK